MTGGPFLSTGGPLVGHLAHMVHQLTCWTRPHRGAVSPPPPPPAGRGLTLAGTGGDAPPPVCQECLFCLPVECHQFFYSLPTILFTSPWKFPDPDPLTFDLWRHDWGHVRRKMRSVAHNFQASSFLLVIWMWTCSPKEYSCFLQVIRSYAIQPRSTEDKWGQWPLPSFLSSTDFEGNLRRWFRFRHSFCTKKTWNNVM